MARLLPAETVDEVIRRVVAANLHRQRDALMAQIDPAYVVTLESNDNPLAQLMIDLGALNATTQAVGGELPLRLWLRAAALLARLPDDKAWFAARADSVVPLPPNRPAEAEAQASETIETLQALGFEKPRLREALAQARSEFEAIAADLKLLVGYKRLHDSLHDIQLWRLPTIQATLALSAPLAGTNARTIRREVEQLRQRTQIVVGDLDYFPADSERRTDEASWVAELVGCHAALADAVNTADVGAAGDALTELRSLVKKSMNRLNFQLSYSIRDLRIVPLVDHLRAFAGNFLAVDDPRAAVLREAATQLLQLKQEIGSLKLEHNAWQDVDDRLWTAEDCWQHLNESAAALRSFLKLWPDVVARVKRIADTAPGGWYATLTTYQEALASFHPLIAPVPDPAFDAFSDFTTTARTQFFAVDRSLIDRCNRLELVAQPLEDLARTL